MIEWVYDDGGRASTGYKGMASDCVTRAIAIAGRERYQKIYDLINEKALAEKPRKQTRSSARKGVNKRTTRKIMEELGWTWNPTMLIGGGCRVHLDPDELPEGRLVVQLSGHVTAVIDGVVHDLYDPSRGGTRCVYGYWYQNPFQQWVSFTDRIMVAPDTRLGYEELEQRSADAGYDFTAHEIQIMDLAGQEYLSAQPSVHVGTIKL